MECGLHWTWAKTADEAIEILKSGGVEFASLDHDLAEEHYYRFFKVEREGGELDTSDCKEKTGYEVMLWMKENNVWPKDGVRIHTMNSVRKPIMIAMVEEQYGRSFQYQYAGTHRV